MKPAGVPSRLPLASVARLESASGPWCIRLLPLFLLLSTGCVSHWRGQDIESDVAALQGQVEQITESSRTARQKMRTQLNELNARLTEVEGRFEDAIDRIRTTIADRGLDLDEIRQQIAERRGKADELKGKLQEAASGVHVPTIQGAPPLPETANELYRYGWDQKGAENCIEAIRAFATFVSKFSGNDRADNALYLMAECQFRAKNYTASVRSLQTILQKYPRGDKIDDGLLLMHDNFLALGRCKDAMPFLETLLADYPRSNRVRSARRKLARTRRKCK